MAKVEAGLEGLAEQEAGSEKKAANKLLSRCTGTRHRRLRASLL